jgi:hypothetical protein
MNWAGSQWGFDELVKMMVEADWRALQSDAVE